MGRKLSTKYRTLIEKLEPAKLYSPAMIADLNKEIKRSPGEAEPRERYNARKALSQFAVNHFFPKEGDGMVTPDRGRPERGWLGSRWQEALD